MSKAIRILLISLALLVMLAIPVLAQEYTADVYTAEVNGNDYDMYPALIPLNVTGLVADNYITATGLDTRVMEGTTQLPHMLANNKLLFANELPGNSSNTVQFTTGNAALTDTDVVVGYGGYVTIPNNAALEPAADFEFDQTGYIDTSVGLRKALVYKRASFLTYVGEVAQRVTSVILNAEAIGQNNGVHNGNCAVYGDIWEAQTFTPAATRYVAMIRLMLAKTGTPSGNFIVSIRATAGGLPTGDDLAIGWVEANSIAAGPAQQNIVLRCPVQVTNGVTYAIVVRCPDGNATNNIIWRFQSPQVYGGGQRCDSTDSGDTWAAVAAADFEFAVFGSTAQNTVSANLVPSGERIVVTTATGATTNLFNIDVDGGTYTGSVALAGASCPAGNDYTIMVDTLEYMEYMTISCTVAGGTLQFDPDSIIAGTTLPDEDGTQDGTITWGSNPAGVSASIGSLEAYGEEGVDTEVISPDVAGEIGEPDTMFPSEEDMLGTGLTWLYPTISDIADLTDTPVVLFWWLLAGIFILASIAAAFKYTQNLFLTGTMAVAAIGACIGMSFLPFWFILIAVIVVIVVATMERSPSV